MLKNFGCQCRSKIAISGRDQTGHLREGTTAGEKGSNVSKIVPYSTTTLDDA